jgi:hypothetical protein
MKSILILQQLWRQRIITVVALLVAVCIGAFISFRVSPGLPPHFQSRQYVVGIASARVLVDTPDSIVADLNPSGAASLSLHAQLLADLIASQPIRTAIASSLKIPLQSLAVVPPALAGAPPVATPLANAITPPSGASTLTIGVDSTLPLVSISAEAPNAARAAQLAEGAVAELRSYLVSVAAAQKIPASRQPRITSLGIQSAATTKGPSRLYGVAATIVLFMFFCYCGLVVSGFRQRARELELVGEPQMALAEPQIALAEPQPAVSETPMPETMPAVPAPETAMPTPTSVPAQPSIALAEGGLLTHGTHGDPLEAPASVPSANDPTARSAQPIIPALSVTTANPVAPPPAAGAKGAAHRGAKHWRSTSLAQVLSRR